MRKLAQALILTLTLVSPIVFAEDAKIACTDLVMDYAHHRDNFNAESFANLFTEDGVLVIGEDRWQGRAAIQARIEALDNSATTRHYMSSIRVSPIDADHASGVSYVVIYRAPQGNPAISGPILIGDYIDRYVRTEAGWKIAHRELVTTFTQR